MFSLSLFFIGFRRLDLFLVRSVASSRDRVSYLRRFGALCCDRTEARECVQMKNRKKKPGRRPSRGSLGQFFDHDRCADYRRSASDTCLQSLGSGVVDPIQRQDAAGCQLSDHLALVRIVARARAVIAAQDEGCGSRTGRVRIKEYAERAVPGRREHLPANVIESGFVHVNRERACER